MRLVPGWKREARAEAEAARPTYEAKQAAYEAKKGRRWPAAQYRATINPSPERQPT